MRADAVGISCFTWRIGSRINSTLGAALMACITAAAQDIPKNVTYVCGGERLYVESCNIRDLSDTSTCQVAHPDRPMHNGFLAYSSETRGTLKKLLPTCQQPSAKEIAAAEAFKKKQQEILDANIRKANPQMNNPANTQANRPASGQAGGSVANVRPPRNAEERAIRRCVSSGRLVATCTGNSLLGAFGQMLNQFVPALGKEPAPGPEISGAYEGPGNWRIDFTDAGVLVNCSMLSPDERRYSFKFENNRAAIVIDMTPKPLVLTLSADQKSMTGPGPVVVDGVVATGYDSGLRDQFGNQVSNPTFATGPVYDTSGQRVYHGGGVAGHATFSPKRVTCPAQNLSSKGAAPPVLQMGTDLLKSMFNDGDKGPPTPPGIRMHGIYAAASGFSVQFFPESAILGCGPDVARAYPYTVVADGTKAFIKIDAPDHPLALGFRPDGSLDAGTGPYQVHGRIAVGQNDNGDFTFAPLEAACNLGVLTPSKEIPSTGGTAVTATPSIGAPATGTPATGVAGGGLSTPQAPLGNATLTIVSGLPGAPNPLAGHPYILLRDSYANAIAKGGVAVPAGMSAYKFVGTACGTRTPDCQKANDAIKANAASAVRADANGNGTFPGVPPGTYYLMISTRYNNQSLVWGQAVQLKAGANSIKLDGSNAAALN